MAEWHCFKCKEKVVSAEIPMIYMDIEGETEGLICPRCGAKYIMEDIATTKVAKGEKMIENK